MIKLNISCETTEEARMYLNALQYQNLISDLYQALRSARKHGTDGDVLRVVDTFTNDLCSAVDHSEGPY